MPTNDVRPSLLVACSYRRPPHLVADLELGHRRAALRDNAGQLMTGHARVPVPVVNPYRNPGRVSRKNGRG
jgi:hypothetical protein